MTTIEASVGAVPPVSVSVIGMVSGELVSCADEIASAPLKLPAANPAKFTETVTVPAAQELVGVTESQVWVTAAVNGVQAESLSIIVTDCAAGALPPTVPVKVRDFTLFPVTIVYFPEVPLPYADKPITHSAASRMAHRNVDVTL